MAISKQKDDKQNDYDYRPTCLGIEQKRQSILELILYSHVHHHHIIPTQTVGVVAQSIERATPGEEIPGSIPTVAARSLLVGSEPVKCDLQRQKSWSPNSVSYVAARKIVRPSVLEPVRDIT